MRRPRVLLVTPDFPPATGGVQRVLGNIVARCTGWETRVVTIDPAGESAHSSMSAWLRPTRIAQLNAMAACRGIAWRPDAIISGHVVASPAALLLHAALRVPVVQYVYAMELLHRHRLSRVALARSTVTVALSEHAAGIARSAGADPARLRIIPPGVDVPDRSPQPAAKFELPTILTVARLTDRYKGFDVMLRAMPLVRARIPAARWVVIGDGPLRGELERTARAWALEDAVLLLGQISDRELDEWFARAHAFAMLSRLPADGSGEGYGLVYLEAGARGLPCVAGNAGAVAEAVIDGETGVLVDATDHVEAAAALIALLTDADRAAKLGAAGRARVRTLSWESMAAALEALVEELIGSSR